MKYSHMISLAGLDFGYGVALPTVLKGLCLDIPAGSVTAILGPNGAGKTTLLHVILGRLLPRAGTVMLNGREQSSYSRRQMSQLVGLVPQSEYIPFEFSLLDYVLLGRAPYLGALEMPRESDRQRAQEALQAMGLDHLQDRPVPSLSGGERQLAMVARALAQQPRILLLDEPTSHLDLSNQGRILKIMRTLADGGVTVAFTTHDPGAAADIADFVVLLRRGQVLAASTMEAVLNSQQLSETYGVPLKVVRLAGRPIVLPA